jgi:hypothetical protein
MTNGKRCAGAGVQSGWIAPDKGERRIIFGLLRNHWMALHCKQVSTVAERFAQSSPRNVSPAVFNIASPSWKYS